MLNFKKSTLSCALVSVLMLGDFNASSVVEETDYQNGQQSLSSLTDFSGWSLGLNEAKAGCGDNNSCNENYDTMVIIGDPIDDGWGDWDFWDWNFGDAWNQFWDDYWDNVWEFDFGGFDYQSKAHCLSHVSNVTNACYATAGSGSAVIFTSCNAYAAALGVVGVGICGVAGIATAGGTFFLCSEMSNEAINRCHAMFPSNNSGGSGSANAGNGGSYDYGGGDYGHGDFDGGSGEFEWSIP